MSHLLMRLSIFSCVRWLYVFSLLSLYLLKFSSFSPYLSIHPKCKMCSSWPTQLLTHAFQTMVSSQPEAIASEALYCEDLEQPYHSVPPFLMALTCSCITAKVPFFIIPCVVLSINNKAYIDSHSPIQYTLITCYM